MYRLSSYFLRLLAISSTVSSLTLAGPSLDSGTRIALAKSLPDAIQTVIVHLPGKLDLSKVKTKGSPASSTRRVAGTLKEFTHRSAAKLHAFLDAQKEDDVLEATEIWITNSVRVRATTTVVKGIVALGVGESVVLEQPKLVEELRDRGFPWRPDFTWQPPIGWGVRAIRAPELWEQDVRGQGVVVAVIDSGANVKHADLQKTLWTNPGETGRDAKGRDKATNGIDDDGNGFVDDVYGWNFESNSNDLTDSESHGTKSAGIVAGDGTSGQQTGVAPGAKLMILRSCCDALESLFESNNWLAMEYAVENGARVISMSLTVKAAGEPAYERWRRAGENLLAAGIVHVNSAGNVGSRATPNNIGSPASNPPAWFPPGTLQGAKSSMITVGAVNEKDEPRSYSSTGPVTWERILGYRDYLYDGGKLPGLTKPEVCAPSQVPSLDVLGNGYVQSFGGTSSATPHVAGVVALLLSRYPLLTVERITEALEMSAVPVGKGYNNQCGAGRIDALSAMQYIEEHFK